ncbi:hypothetical protein SAMN04487910_3246 [Aquimarina amphilecti]|uniref:Antitoxin component YwqK of the YwqJK toxin-antitoxin module n=1 Tax=Aquimarina amphilecti TaxID=1038014 RepID=A0A1H7T474_AQUAM|nr:hypothetical protein [Aquimarina amphilecti]SEL78597.1 hypothetical protein SAMN04487910_3246 [Aquimarina amphilecti]
MEDRFIKNIVLVVFVLNNLLVFSQNFKGYEYTELAGYEYEEFTKNGNTNKMDGNFSITTRSKKGDIITIEIKRFDKGEKTGEWITYRNLFGGLKLSFVANYKDNVLEGYYFESDNHTFSKKGFYKKGKKHGYWEHSENDTHENINYKNGLKCGSYSSEDNMSGIQVKGQYKKDKKDGTWIIKDTTIEEVTKEVYKNGKLISSED